MSGRWQVVITGAVLFWVIHDGLINVVGLKKPFFYVGKTAQIDKFFQQFKNPILIMAIAKALILIISTLTFLL
jgi:hypothetical protein